MSRLITHFMVEDYHGEPEEIRYANTGNATNEPFLEDSCEYWASQIAECMHSEMDYPEECTISFYAGSERVCTVNVEARMETVFYAMEMTDINHRAEIIAALRAELERIEAGGEIAGLYSMKIGDVVDLHESPECAHTTSVKKTDDCVASNSQVRTRVEWGVMVPARKSVIVDREYRCKCWYPSVSRIKYGMEPVGYVEEPFSQKMYPAQCTAECGEVSE